MFFSGIPLCPLHLTTCLTGWVYDQVLGPYWLNRAEAPLLTLFWMGGGGAKFALPAGFFNIAQKPLGIGSWNLVTFSFYI